MGLDYEFTTNEVVAILMGMAIVIVWLALYVHKKNISNEKKYM